MSTTAVTPLQTNLDNSENDYLRQVINRLVAQQDADRNGVLASAAVATATVTSQVKTVTNPTPFVVDGQILSLAASDNFWTLTGGVQAISSWNKWLLLVNAAGAASVAVGTASTVSAAAVVLPAIPASKAVFGVLTVATDGTHTFTPGTTLLGAAGITATYVQGLDPLYTSGSAVISPTSLFQINSHK